MSLTQQIKGTYFNAGTGIRLNRAAAADAVGPTNLFTISGGLILLTGLYGVVTILRAGALATQVFTHTATALCVATPMISATVGTVITITGDVADLAIIGIGTGVANTVAPLQGGLKGSALGGTQMFGMILGVGSITTTISVVTAGATRYILTYIPLDNTSSVA
jgi:hypothetical protein